MNTPMQHPDPIGLARAIGGVEAAIRICGRQADLAALLGIKQQTVSQWKQRGHLPVHIAIQIEDLLGIPAEYLVAGTTHTALPR